MPHWYPINPYAGVVTPSEPCGLTYDLKHLEEAQFIITFNPAVFITAGTC